MQTSFEIKNHFGNSPVEVKAKLWYMDPGIGVDLGTVTQHCGAMSFQHAMTTKQARAMADALLACCEELERVPA